MLKKISDEFLNKNIVNISKTFAKYKIISAIITMIICYSISYFASSGSLLFELFPFIIGTGMLIILGALLVVIIEKNYKEIIGEK